MGTNAGVAARDSNVPEFRVMCGSKTIPENFIYGSKEALGLLKESLGIASARDGTATGGITYDTKKSWPASTLNAQSGDCGVKAFQRATGVHP